MKKNKGVKIVYMLEIARKDGYILYYDSKYNEYLVVTPNCKITRYWKRLKYDIVEYFEERIKENEGQNKK